MGGQLEGFHYRVSLREELSSLSLQQISDYVLESYFNSYLVTCITVGDELTGKGVAPLRLLMVDLIKLAANQVSKFHQARTF